ncbi:hypothetical protein CAOG_009474 [Capsaspora owczarzaki ATCC 30864]|uniref:Uncharacterized protein n=1 Tax=Capsaspora owczarzaki (strain ATCC 30864) TaxID=595528 RepID=A0A0D2U684_CAPO3|nr:hypothetical protein CAOG_009474 [Capsaspora owczarzaki ATCC 30864]
MPAVEILVRHEKRWIDIAPGLAECSVGGLVNDKVQIHQTIVLVIQRGGGRHDGKQAMSERLSFRATQQRDNVRCHRAIVCCILSQRGSKLCKVRGEAPFRQRVC